MPIHKCQTPKKNFRALSVLMCLSASVFATTLALAQDSQIPASLQNSTSQAVDYHVILSDGSAQYIGSIAAGQSASDQFLSGEVILVTPQGSTSVLKQFNFDGTPNSVMTVSAPTGPTRVRESGASSNINTAPDDVTESAPEEPKVIISDEFKEWIETDYIDHDPRVPNTLTYQEGFQDKLRTEIIMRQGYNILKMDPSNLTDRGLGGSAPNIIAPLAGSSYNWTINAGASGLGAPNDLVIKGQRSSTQGSETTEILFTSEQERKSSSLNVGLGLAAKGTAKEGGKDAASGKVGIEKSQTQFENTGSTKIRKQIVGEGYWMIYAKEYMHLGPTLEKVLRDKNNLRTYNDFVAFFERYGTHWPVATLLGGYARSEETLDSSEIGNEIKKSLSVEGSVTVPVKAVEVTPSIGYSESEEQSLTRKRSSSNKKFTTRGGVPGANYDNWSMATQEQASNYVPLKVELRGIHELIWPELMDITDPAEANRIHALRAKTAEMLDRYTSGISTKQYDWNPRIYGAEFELIEVDKDDDEGRDVEMEFFGTAKIIGPTSPSPVIAVSIEQGDKKSLIKGSSLLKGNAQTMKAVKTATAVSAQENGRIVSKPKFDTSGTFVFESSFYEHDKGSANEVVFGKETITIAQVEASPQKKVSKTGYYSDDGEGIKVMVTVKRLNYDLKNDSFELQSLPLLRRFSEGSAIAAREISVTQDASGGTSSVTQVASSRGTSSVTPVASSGGTSYGQNLPRFRRTINAAISGYNKKKVKGTVVQCQIACAQETSFVCRSFDYYKSGKSCDLSDKVESQIPLKTTYANNPYDYYEIVSGSGVTIGVSNTSSGAGVANRSTSQGSASNYNVQIKTSDMRGAGTDSNITLQLIGNQGVSRSVALNKLISGNAFERNKIVSVRFTDPKNVGPISYVTLRSDGRGFASAWNVEYVNVNGVTFNCGNRELGAGAMICRR